MLRSTFEADLQRGTNVYREDQGNVPEVSDKGGDNKKCVQVTGQHLAYLGTQQWFLKAGVQLIHEG